MFDFAAALHFSLGSHKRDVIQKGGACQCLLEELSFAQGSLLRRQLIRHGDNDARYRALGRHLRGKPVRKGRHRIEDVFLSGDHQRVSQGSQCRRLALSGVFGRECPLWPKIGGSAACCIMRLHVDPHSGIACLVPSCRQDIQRILKQPCHFSFLSPFAGSSEPTQPFLMLPSRKKGILTIFTGSNFFKAEVPHVCTHVSEVFRVKLLLRLFHGTMGRC